ncbi:MAG: hypothetical protein WC814_01165 [Candidatus Paceibacterota bacterium]
MAVPLLHITVGIIRTCSARAAASRIFAVEVEEVALKPNASWSEPSFWTIYPNGISALKFCRWGRTSAVPVAIRQ